MAAGIDRGKAEKLFQEKADIERELQRRYNRRDSSVRLAVLDQE